jgi:polygalacturonase
MRHAILTTLLILSASAAFTAGIPPVPAPLDFPLPKLLPAGRDFPITDFGAIPDGKTLNTTTIQKAIDACSAAGGGTVVIPRTDHGSVYMSGAIFLKKGASLRIEKDAVLKAWLDPAQYPIIDTRFEGTERPFMSAFLNATNLDGITVSGEGTLDGSGDQWLNVITKGPRAGRVGRAGSILPVSTPAPAPHTVLTPTPDNPPPLQLVSAGSNRPRLALFSNCTNTAIKGLHLQNQAVWCLHILYCSDFLVDNVTILDPTHTVPSSDGIDIDSSRWVRVNKTTISVNDDCISIKSGKDADGRRVNRACEDILIVNSHMAEGQGGVAMGSEVSGTIRNVEVRDTLVDSGNWAPIRFKSQDTRGGTVENIVYRNLKIANVRQVFDFNLNWSATSRSGPRMPTTVKNIYIINVTGTASGGGSIVGLPDSPVTDILFRDCDFTCGTPVRFINTANLDTAGLKITLLNGRAAFTSTNSTPNTQDSPNIPGTQTQPGLQNP